MAYFILHAPRQVGKTTALTAMARSLSGGSIRRRAGVNGGRGASRRRHRGGGRRHPGGVRRTQSRSRYRPSSTRRRGPRRPRASASTARCTLGRRRRRDRWWSSSTRSMRSATRRSSRCCGSSATDTAFGRRASRGRLPWWACATCATTRSPPGGASCFTRRRPSTSRCARSPCGRSPSPEVAELYDQHSVQPGSASSPPRSPSSSPSAGVALARERPRLRRDHGSSARPRRDDGRLDVGRARDLIVERQETHLDSLAERLRDPRVRAVIEPMILGDQLASASPDDLRFVLDLGLVVQWTTAPSRSPTRSTARS